MSFSYQSGNNPRIDYIRLLVGDTVSESHIWEDEEIEAAYGIQGSIIQSGMFYSGTAKRVLPSSAVSYYRVAAVLLDGLASSRSRLASVVKLLDVMLSADTATSTARALRERAKELREIDDESGSFAIIEQTTTCFSFRDRFLRQVQRMTPG